VDIEQYNGSILSAGLDYSVITAQAAKGNSASAGMKAGDQVIYHSSFFGDELWPVSAL
jgi:hypothetical protein